MTANSCFKETVKQTKITKSARGEDCSLRIPGVCNFNPETTVFCHIGHGPARRNFDFGVYGCSSCHDVIDRRVHLDDAWENSQLPVYQLSALRETQEKLIDKGLMKC